MKKILLFTLAGLLFTSCGSSYLKNSTNVSNEKKSYEKIVVIARAKDNTARINFENQVVKDLGALGVNAIASIEVLKPEMLSENLSEKDIEKLRRLLVEEGYDGAIVTNLINAAQYTDVNSGGTGTAYVPVRYGRFGRYYRTYPVSYWEPDEVEVGMEYTLESCLYDIRNNENDNLQWVGRFKVKDPNDLMKVIQKYSSELTAELMEQSIQQ